jgi:hypothetical protein
VREKTALARRYRIDVNTGTEGAPTWVQLMGVMDFKPLIDPKIETSSDYEDEGADGNQKVGYKWTLDITVRRKRSTAGVYDAAQEHIRLKDLQSGDEASVQVRWYERNGGVEAYQGWTVPKWEPDQTGSDALAHAKITMTGDGQVVPIANPS